MNFVRKSVDLRRVVVTGIGIISPLGKKVAENWENIKNGVNGIDKITRFDASGYYSQIAGEVKNYDYQDYFDRKEVRKYDPYIQFALIASQEAITDSEIMKYNDLNTERFGVYVGSGIGGIRTIADNMKALLERGPTRVSPFFLPASIANLAAGQVSIKFGLKGPNLANVTACATSTHSIGDSYRIVQRGDADIMLAGGAEFPITELGVAGFSVMRALSARNDEPQKSSRPFDKGRDGFVVAEGSGIVILEDLEHAVNRGAKIYAEVIGYGFRGDAYHMTAPHPEADGMYRTMRAALEESELQPTEIDCINAHGTSTPLNDKFETMAVKKLFKGHAPKINISGTKSMTGHMLGATGAAETIFSVLSIYNSFVPPTINYEIPDEDCDLNYTPNKGIEKEVRTVLSNSFGFGGTNGSLIFKKFEKN